MKTQTDKTAYLKSGGMQCPFCGSTTITSPNTIKNTEIISNSENMQRDRNCPECNRWWTETFVLHDIRFPNGEQIQPEISPLLKDIFGLNWLLLVSDSKQKVLGPFTDWDFGRPEISDMISIARDSGFTIAHRLFIDVQSGNLVMQLIEEV